MRKRSICIILLVLLLLCSAPAQSASYNAYINARTKVYCMPSTSSQALRVAKGTAVKVTAYNSGWCKIKSGSSTAYIQAKYLTAAIASNIDSVVLTAMNQVGKLYGRNPPKKFDCSALVQYCFKKNGYRVKGTAAAIAADNTYPKVKKSAIVKGDIICMDADSNGKCDHVGIYIGKNCMIEASFTAGIVRVKKLNSWYKNHIMYARRVS